MCLQSLRTGHVHIPLCQKIRRALKDLNSQTRFQVPENRNFLCWDDTPKMLAFPSSSTSSSHLWSYVLAIITHRVRTHTTMSENPTSAQRSEFPDSVPSAQHPEITTTFLDNTSCVGLEFRHRSYTEVPRFGSGVVDTRLHGQVNRRHH